MFAHHITNEEIDELPYVAFGGKITVVRKAADVPAAVAHLVQQKVIGYDTEARPSFTRGLQYGVSLLQLSSAEQAFLFRVDKVGLPDDLLALLQNRQVLKVGAAIHDDIRGLQRIAPFKAQGFVDLQKLTAAYGIEDNSLKKMAAIVLGFRISKSQQTSNWAAMSYTAEQKQYAATDAWVCREIYMKLLNQHDEVSPAVAESFVDMEKPPKVKQQPPPPNPNRRRPSRRRRRRRRKAAANNGSLQKATPQPAL